jgi:sialidase-1
MKSNCLLSIPLVLLFSCKTSSYLPGKETNSTVFSSGSNGYSHYRIPAIHFAKGTLFAFAEARKNSVDDNGNISIVLKKSHDYGITWSSLIKVVEIEGESVQNPVPVFISGNHKLIVLFTKRTVGDDSEYQLRNGTSKGFVGVYKTESSDLGENWSVPVEITASVKKMEWRWYTVGPGGAIIQKYNKKLKNRIIVPSNHSTDKGPGNEFLGTHVIYSDDGGNSWEIGATDSEGFGSLNPNETCVVELSDGSLYFNTRNQNANDTDSNRGFALSNDGGLTFKNKFNYENGLQTPVVHASMTRNKKSVFFIAPCNPKERINLSLWTSNDECKTWNLNSSIYKGSSAYSSSCMISEKTLAILFEADDYSRIVFQSIKTD